MREVVYNSCYGGFGLSDQAIELYLERKNKDYTKQVSKWGSSYYYIDGESFFYEDIERHDPDLIYVVKELGEKARGSCAELAIQEVEGLYRIEEYDGYESVIENYSDWK